MPRRRGNPPDDLRIALAHAVGLDNYPTDSVAEPYLNYLTNRHIGRGTREQYLALFLRVIAHFQCGNPNPDPASQSRPDSIQALLDALSASETDELFLDTRAKSRMRREDVEDTVMYIMGAWSMMLSSFVQLPNRARKVAVACSLRSREGEGGGETTAYGESLAAMVQKSRLLPAPDQCEDDPHLDLGDDIMQAALKLLTVLSRPKYPGSDGSIDDLGSYSPAPWSVKPESRLTRSQLSCYSLDNMDSLESLSIKSTRLNAYTLKVLGAVEIFFTHNVSRHMLLSRHGGRHILEIFALPCAFTATTLTSGIAGLSSELAQEVQESYCILFNAFSDTPLHVRLGAFFGLRKVCLCWSCSSYRYRMAVIAQHKRSFIEGPRQAARHHRRNCKDEFDPLLVELMGNESSDWTYDLFPCLWPRITLLQEHIQAARPWSIWVLFRDRRDTLQFWTFFFATVVVLLTVMQVVLGIAQVVGSFE